MIYILITMALCFPLMFIWAIQENKKEKKRLENFRKGLDKSRKMCYNKYVR